MSCLDCKTESKLVSDPIRTAKARIHSEVRVKHGGGWKRLFVDCLGSRRVKIKTEVHVFLPLRRVSSKLFSYVVMLT
eukprot:6180243-Pleurochrysis_carterae.AAC.1